MKTALLHYWLTNMRGGEKVLAALGEMLPESVVYTHALGKGMRDEIEGRVRGMRWRGHEVRESFIAHLPFGRKWTQAYLPLMPMANRRFNLDGYDLIISSESGPIKGIRKPKDARHICYCHTPMRYVWDMYDEYYQMTGFGGKIAMKLFTPYMRYEDLKSADSVDTFIANSRFVADRIKRIYGRDAAVVHPPVDVDFFSTDIEDRHSELASRGDLQSPYYLFAGQLIGYKRADLAIAACVRMGRRIVIIGDGNQRAALERQYAAIPLVSFVGWTVGDELKALYRNAKALLSPGLEDFGIVPVEAQAAGTPIIAYGRGGALETVRDGETGLFFPEQTVESLCYAIEEFESHSWDRRACLENAKRFKSAEFVKNMREVIAG